METPSRSRDALEEDLQDLPPSAKLVFKTLHYEGDLTQQELAEETFLPPRTARSAVTKLEENGIVTSQISFRDARQRVYSLVPPFQEGEIDHSRQ